MGNSIDIETTIPLPEGIDGDSTLNDIFNYLSANAKRTNVYAYETGGEVTYKLLDGKLVTIMLKNAK